MSAEQFTNAAQSTLVSTITSGSTTLVVTSATGFPAIPQFRILIDSEVMIVTGVAGTTFTVSRAAEAVSGVQAATSHADGALVTHVVTAGAMSNLPYAGGSGTASGTNTGDQTITLTGDVTGTGTGTFAATLKNTGTAGTYGDGSHYPIITTDAQGRVTAATLQSVGGGSPFADNAALVKNNSDNTKLAILSAAGITTGTTRTYTLPNVTDTLAVIGHDNAFSSAQTFGGLVKNTSGGFIVPNNALTTGYQAYRADGTTPMTLISNKSGNNDVVIDPGGVSGFAIQFGQSGTASGGPNLFILNSASLYYESHDYSQDLPIIHTDTSNKLYFGDANGGGTSQQKDMYFQTPTGNTFHWSFNAGDQMTLSEAQLKIYGTTFQFTFSNGNAYCYGNLITQGQWLYLGVVGEAGLRAIATGVTAPIINAALGGWFQNTGGEGALSSGFTNATATLSGHNTNLSYTLIAGRSYRVRGILVISNSTAGEGAQFDFNGGGATIASMFVTAHSISGTNTPGTLVSTSLAGVINWSSLTGTSYIAIDGYIKCANAGTLILRGAENTTSSGTMTLAAGSWIALDDTVIV